MTDDDPDYGDVPRDAKGDPVFLILPAAMREDYESMMEGCRKGWRETGDPLVIAEAVTLARYYRQTLPAWLDEAVWRLADRRRTKAQGKRAHEAAIRFHRYMAVRDFHDYGRTWEASYAEATRALAPTMAAAEPDTMRAAYKKVKGDLKSGRSGRYFNPKRQYRKGNRV